MTNEEYGIMLAAADSVYSNGINNIPNGYYKIDYFFEDYNKTVECIISFAGTQDLQDV